MVARRKSACLRCANVSATEKRPNEVVLLDHKKSAKISLFNQTLTVFDFLLLAEEESNGAYCKQRERDTQLAERCRLPCMRGPLHALIEATTAVRVGCMGAEDKMAGDIHVLQRWPLLHVPQHRPQQRQV